MPVEWHQGTRACEVVAGDGAVVPVRGTITLSGRGGMRQCAVHETVCCA
jgi:hypothetical protein